MAKRTCSVDGCERPHVGRGFCGMHYKRWKIYGDPLMTREGAGGALPVRLRGGTVVQRFWFHVDRGGPGCWEWMAGTNAKGYGRFGVADDIVVFAHRFAWEITFGGIPHGLLVCHRCDNPPCCRPDSDHLFLGTNDDNMADMAAKGRSWNGTKTHCPRGHPYDQTNTGIAKGNGQRYCRTCKRLQHRKPT